MSTHNHPRGRAMPRGAERDAYLADVRKRAAAKFPLKSLFAASDNLRCYPGYSVKNCYRKHGFFMRGSMHNAQHCHCAYAPLSDEDIAYYAELGRQAVQS